MNMLANLKTEEGIEDEKDVVMSGGPLDSGIYAGTVALAYLGKSQGGAMSLTLHIKTEARELRNTVYITSGDAKGNKNYYERDGERKYLPGFNIANSLCLLTIGKEIASLETEEKVVSLFDFDAKKEVPTKVQVLTDLLGQEALFAVLRQIVDKNTKDAAGKYVPTGEVREENEIDKIFRARDRMTTAEIRAQATEPSFYNTWIEKNAGKVRNKAKGAGANTGAPGLPGAPAATLAAPGKPASSLFD